MMELTSDNLRLIQAYIRHYIGNEQYNEFIIMSVQVGDNKESDWVLLGGSPCPWLCLGLRP